MIRISRVTVRGDGRPCVYRAILENGVAVLSMWKLTRVSVDEYFTYERVG